VVDVVRGQSGVAHARRQIHRGFLNKSLTSAAAAAVSVCVSTDNWTDCGPVAESAASR